MLADNPRQSHFKAVNRIGCEGKRWWSFVPDSENINFNADAGFFCRPALVFRKARQDNADTYRINRPFKMNKLL